jgi:hypothetical protein
LVLWHIAIIRRRNRQHQDGLRHESAGEGKGACDRNPQRVNDDVREPRPEIQRAGENRGCGGNLRSCAISTSGAKMTRFSTAFVCDAIIRCAQAVCGASLGEGLPMARVIPRTIVRSRM